MRPAFITGLDNEPKVPGRLAQSARSSRTEDLRMPSLKQDMLASVTSARVPPSSSPRREMETTDNQCTSKLAELRAQKMALRSQYTSAVGRVAFLDEAGRKTQHRLAETERVLSAVRTKRRMVDEDKTKKMEYEMYMDELQQVKLEKVEEERKRKEALREKKMDLFENKRKEVGDLRRSISQTKMEGNVQRSQAEASARSQAREFREKHGTATREAHDRAHESLSSLHERRKQEQADNEALVRQRQVEQIQRNRAQAERVQQEEKRVIDDVRNRVTQQNRQKTTSVMQERMDAEAAEIQYYMDNLDRLQDREKKAQRHVEETERRLRTATDAEGTLLTPSSPLRLPRSS